MYISPKIFLSQISNKTQPRLGPESTPGLCEVIVVGEQPVIGADWPHGFFSEVARMIKFSLSSIVYCPYHICMYVCMKYDKDSDRRISKSLSNIIHIRDCTEYTYISYKFIYAKYCVKSYSSWINILSTLSLLKSWYVWSHANPGSSPSH